MGRLLPLEDGDDATAAPPPRRVRYGLRAARGPHPRSTGAIDASVGGGARRVVVDSSRELHAR
jgi:hypothetical protein